MNEEMNVSSFIDDFEATGAQVSNLYLDEGIYKAILADFSVRAGVAVASKGENKGNKFVWNFWQARFDLDSLTAQNKLKRDNKVSVYTDQATEGFSNRSLTLCPVGIAKDGNISFWNFVGKLVTPLGHATFSQDDAGNKQYKFGRSFLEAFFGGVQSLKDELESTIPAGVDFASLSSEQQDVKLLIPAKLAEKQLKNLSEFLANESDAKRMYVSMQIRSNSQDSSKKEHFVKSLMSVEEFEANPNRTAFE